MGEGKMEVTETQIERIMWEAYNLGQELINDRRAVIKFDAHINKTIKELQEAGGLIE